MPSRSYKSITYNVVSYPLNPYLLYSSIKTRSFSAHRNKYDPLEYKEQLRLHKNRIPFFLPVVINPKT